MPTATSEDTEITLGTGKMLALFFGLVTLCAVFFAVGFSLGKQTALKPSAQELNPPAAAGSGTLRPVSAKTSTPAPRPADADKAPDPPASTDAANSAEASPPATNASAPDPASPPVLNGYFVQVAAVSKQEDADALVDALKKKEYPAFSANAPSDKLFHVQCGPYADIQEAEALRAKLISDGYNPILKK